jgi:hypothetical protein
MHVAAVGGVLLLWLWNVEHDASMYYPYGRRREELAAADPRAVARERLQGHRYWSFSSSLSTATSFGFRLWSFSSAHRVQPKNSAVMWFC